MPYGSYNNTLDDVLSSPTAEISWMAKNKSNPHGWDYISLYGISSFDLTGKDFANVVYQCYLKKIKIGIAWSSLSQVDSVIAYNKKQTDGRKKIIFMTSELEAEYANNNCTKSEYKAWIPQAFAKLKPLGIKSFIYEGWNYMYDTTVGNCDGYLLHAYRTTAQMNTKDDIYNYMAKAGDDRMIQIAAEAKKKNLIVKVSVLTSCEPPPANDGKGFGYDFYKNHAWGSVAPMVQDSFNRLASQDMKDHLIMDGEFVFVSKFMHQIKP